MKRILIIANTYYQLIIALQMKNTLFKECEVVLFLSDRSNNSNRIAENLKKGHYFDNVKYIETKYLVNRKSVRDKLLNFFENINTQNNRYRYFFEGIDNLYFDEMISFNIDIMIYNFYAILYEYNHDIHFSGYEEGILSYNAQKLNFGGSKEICTIRNMVKKKGIDKSYSNFYCFFPQLYSGVFNPVRIPLITEDNRIAAYLRAIFEIKESDITYQQKYIYFSSVYDFEGGHPIREIEIVQKLAEDIGRDNLIVKIHPRDTRTVYKDNGITVDKNSSIPWEAIQLLGDFSNNVFLTSTSGSVLAGSFLSRYPVKTFYLYKMCSIDGNKNALVSVNNIEKLLDEPSMNEVFKQVKIADSIEDISQ